MYKITKEEINRVIESLILSKDPLILKTIPAKEKKKYILLCIIIHQFTKDRIYTEKEVNLILKPIAEDYVLIRRYLIDYKFLSRTTDGKEYWLNVDLNNYLDYIIK
jgi:hypothetical protein